MISVTNSILYLTRPYGQSGQSKVSVQHTLSNGDIHKTPPVIVDSGFNESELLTKSANQLTQQLTESEKQQYINDVSEGANPFTVEPSFTEINTMRSIVLQHFLAKSDPVELVKAVPLLSILTDEQLMTLLSINQLKVDEIRSRAIDVATLSTNISNYIPPL